jgi:hypothetical protein
MSLKSSLKPSYPKVTNLGGSVMQIRRLVDPADKLWSAFNPSIAYSPKVGYAATIRSSNYVIYLDTGYLEVTSQGEIKNQVWFCEFEEDFSIKNLKKVEFSNIEISLDRGIEDAKLFWREDSWWFTGIMMERGHTPVARVALFKYDHENNAATLVKKYDGPEYAKPEKNWMAPYEVNENFDFIYGPTSIIKDDILITKFNANREISGLRGNTNLLSLEDGSYLAVVHTLYTKKVTYQSRRTFSMHAGTQKFYTHRFAKYDKYGTLIAISREFQFQKNGIEFAAGLVEHGDDYIISYGVDDLSSHLTKIPKSIVMKELVDVTSS